MASLPRGRRWWPGSHLAYVWVCVAIVSLATLGHAGRWNNSNVFIADSGGYYLYLTSKFITNDVGDTSYGYALRKAYRPDQDPNYGVTALPNGKKIFFYPIGMSFFYAPWFGLAHAYALSGQAPATGYSVPYQVLVSLGGLAYALLGLWLLGLELRRYFAEHLVALTILVLGLGTNLFCYATYEPTMAHATLFMLNVLLLRSVRRWYEQGDWLGALGLAATFGFMVLVRPSELLLAGVPVLWGLTSRAAVPQRLAYWLSHWRQLLAMVLLVGLIGSIQLLFWRVVGGAWLIEFYPGQSFDFSKPEIINGLFSVRKGWLVWSPLMAFALLGIFWVRRYVAAALPATLAVLPVVLYVTYSWWDWGYGGSFGARPLISLYPLLSFSLASFWARWWPRLAWPLALVVLLLVLLSLLQSWQYFIGLVNCCEETWEHYTKYFFMLEWPQP